MIDSSAEWLKCNLDRTNRATIINYGEKEGTKTYDLIDKKFNLYSDTTPPPSLEPKSAVEKLKYDDLQSLNLFETKGGKLNADSEIGIEMISKINGYDYNISRSSSGIISPPVGPPPPPTFGSPPVNQPTFGSPPVNPSTFGSPPVNQPTFGSPPVNQPTFGSPTRKPSPTRKQSPIRKQSPTRKQSPLSIQTRSTSRLSEEEHERRTKELNDKYDDYLKKQQHSSQPTNPPPPPSLRSLQLQEQNMSNYDQRQKTIKHLQKYMQELNLKRLIPEKEKIPENIENVNIRGLLDQEGWKEKLPMETQNKIKINVVLGDGSCFFRAVTKALQSLDNYKNTSSQEIRNIIMDSITEEDFTYFVAIRNAHDINELDIDDLLTQEQSDTGNVVDYKEFMKRSDQWATFWHIQRFCDLFGINLLILKERCQIDNSCLTRIITDGHMTDYIVLTYNNAHYNLVVYDNKPIINEDIAKIFIDNLEVRGRISADAIISGGKYKKIKKSPEPKTTTLSSSNNDNINDEYDMFKYIPITPMSIPLSGANLIEDFSNILHDILKKKPRK